MIPSIFRNLLAGFSGMMNAMRARTPEEKARQMNEVMPSIFGSILNMFFGFFINIYQKFAGPSAASDVGRMYADLAGANLGGVGPAQAGPSHARRGSCPSPRFNSEGSTGHPRPMHIEVLPTEAADPDDATLRTTRRAASTRPS